MALRMKDWEVGEDLRDWGWSAATMGRVARKYKLRLGEFVIIMNNAREFGGGGSQPPKCRLYVNLSGRVFSLIPPVSERNKQLSFQLEFNEWLRGFVKNADMLATLDEVDGEINARQERRKRRRR